jgi:glycolate oxidase FAD binding subunit
MAACASSGPLRFGFGTPRDYVIGLRLAHINGELSKCGGKVVKNVAGYDMNKLYVGSFGTLAVLTELTVKLRPLPERAATLMITSPSAEMLIRAGSEILASELRPASLFLTRGLRLDLGFGQSGPEAVFIRFVESSEAVESQIDKTKRMACSGVQVIEIGELEAKAIWPRVADVDLQGPTCFKISVPMSRTADAFSRLTADAPNSIAAADLGTGIIRMAIGADDQRSVELAERWRRDAASLGGTLTIERASLDVRRLVDAWNDPGPSVGLMKSMKASFDPGGLLNPGRFVAGL